jgi:hypothetical protein
MLASGIPAGPAKFSFHPISLSGISKEKYGTLHD